MRTTLRILAALVLLANPLATPLAAQRDSSATITIHAALALDGRGGTIRNAMITVRDGKIVSVAPAKAGAPRATYELGTATVMPGMVDAHVHPGWYVNRKGTVLHGRDDANQAESALGMEGNLYATLMAGVTTIQSVGGPEDFDLRDATERRVVPGPRILTSMGQINNQKLSIDSLRGLVRSYKAQGADLIKLFASAGLGSGGGQTMSDEQIKAVCGEATAVGLRTVVHAISAASVRASTLGGCTEVEHGMFATQSELTLMAEHGTIYDPQICLVLQNYADHKDVFKFSDASIKTLTDAIPVGTAMFKLAIATPGLKIIFGTDAVALAHGHNVEELVCRVRNGGQKPMDAIVSATSAAASALRLGDRLGALAPGLDADIIAVAGDPSKEIEALRNVVFVMRTGVVYQARGASR
jgi:imidazolonepropionase-like amidohydrolase